MALRFPAGPEEHFLGLGERFDSVDQRGRRVDLWVRNGAAGGATYKPVPFWMSTQGYACALDTDRRAWVDFGPDAVTATVDGDTLDAQLFEGRDLADLVGQYTAWVGRPPVPPEWAFGPWKSRDWRVESAETVASDIERQAEHGLPCTVKLIDAGWTSEPNNFQWDRAKYPDPEGLLARLKAAGYEVALWVAPWFAQGTEVCRTLAERGWALRRPDGAPYLCRLSNSPDFLGCLLDFTHPDACAWWRSGIDGLMRAGVRAIKTDFGEQVPADAMGHAGPVLHNAYPRLYNAVTWEAVAPYGGFLLARSAWAGSQRYPGVWAGDQSSDFSPWAGLPSVVRAGQSAGLSGMPYWGSDIGGYFGTPTAECFIRWTEFAAFCPLMEVHGLGERDPWSLGPQVLDVYRRYARLRMSMRPYLLECAREAARTGLPMMRALALTNDPAVFDHDFAEFEFMLGPSLLVAPVCWDGMTRRRVYLPAGCAWEDWWTGERLEGGQVVLAGAPLDRIPLYLRQGTRKEAIACAS